MAYALQGEGVSLRMDLVLFITTGNSFCLYLINLSKELGSPEYSESLTY